LPSIEAEVAEVLPPYEVVLNAGRKQGIVEGALVTVWRTLDVPDPSTRAVKGRVRRPKMRLRVSEVQENISIAESIEFDMSASPTLTTTSLRRERKQVVKATVSADAKSAAIQVGDAATIVPPTVEATGTLTQQFLMKHPLTAEDQAALQPVAGRLSRLVAFSVTNFFYDAISKPVPGSRFDRALKDKLQDAYELARQRLVSAEDHLRSILTLLGPESVLPSFSMFTLIRGAAMATIHARHLLDPTIDEGTRLGRALSIRLENLQQQQKVLPQGSHFDDRVEHLGQRAIDNGVAVIRDRNGAITGFGDGWPSDTELFERYMPGLGKTYFQYLSGYAHSLPWAQFPISRAQPSEDPEIVLIPTDVSVPVLAAVLDAELSLYDETVGFMLGHAGYPADVWTAAKIR
jgi:hypothetical protein